MFVRCPAPGSLSAPTHSILLHNTLYNDDSCGLPLARVYAEPSGGCLLLLCYAVISFTTLFRAWLRYVSSVLWISWDHASMRMKTAFPYSASGK